LVKAANRAGGIDNITVVVLDAVGEDGDPIGGRRVAPPSRRTVGRWGLRAGLTLLVVIVALFGVRWWLDRQWYVGAAGESVAIYQGIPLTILGFDLGHPVEVHKDVPAKEVRALKQKYPDFDDGVTATDRADAMSIVDQMELDVVAARNAAQNGGGSGP
jgi:protein phosphatase